MPIISNCENCGSTLQVDDAYAGLQARCGMCNAIYTVPRKPLEEATADRDRSPFGAGLSGELSAGSNQDTLPEIQPIESPGYAPGNSAEPELEAQKETFWVKVPDGNVYGPADASTILSWADQGRVNGACEVNPNGSQLWLNFTVWRLQQSERRSSSPEGGSSGVGSPNLFGDQFGVQPIPANQKPITASGQGLLILSLGLISWFLCPTILGAPLCSVITLILATNELRKISEGRAPRNDRMLVLIGMWLAIGNMALSAIFVLLFFIGLIS